MITKYTQAVKRFPAKFWVLVGASFIDSLGSTTVFPFFALYITQKFNIGMSDAGILLGVFSVSGFIGSMVGGALTDKFGRRGMILYGLVISAFSSVFMGLVNDLQVFYILAVAAGLLSNIAGPARQAMVADLLPEEQRTEGFGIQRVFGNLAWIVGPSLGGLLAARSFLLLFIVDAIASVITAVIVYRMLPETKPAPSQDGGEMSVLDSIKGYGVITKDRIFAGFILASILMILVYSQMYSTLSVYLRDVHAVSTQAYGAVMSSSAVAVVLFQFSVTRLIKPFQPLVLMAVGSLFYMIGFSMYGFVSAYYLFIMAMVVITIGEMVVMPVGQALVANMAPEEMRGRYMASYGLAWTIPNAIGPWAAGMIMDHYDPRWVWYLAGIIAATSAFGFLLLHSATRQRFSSMAEMERKALTGD